MQVEVINKSELGSSKDFATGETSHLAKKDLALASSTDVLHSSPSEAEMDSSDVSSGEEMEEGEIGNKEWIPSWQKKKRNTGTKGTRGRGSN